MKSATAHATKANDQPAMNSVRFPIGSGDVHAVQKMTRVGGKRRVALELSTSMLLMAALLYEVAISTKSAMYGEQSSFTRKQGARQKEARGRRKLVGEAALFKMLIPTPGSRRRGSAQTRASRRTRSGTVADSEEERSALPTAGTWPAIEAGHRDSLLYSGGKNPRDSAATQASAHHHTHHIEADGTHTSKQDTAAQHTRTASHTTPSSPKLPGGSPAPQSVVALHSMRSGSKEAGSAAGP